MTAVDQEKSLIHWLKDKITDLELAESANLHGLGWNPRVSAMREAGGISNKDADAASVAFQVEFADAEAARAWSRTVFNKLAREFSGKFGTEAMVFTSLFEVV